MFEPFIKGEVKFIKEELQKEIDDKINHINNNLIQLRNDSITTSVKNEKFYITRKNFKYPKEWKIYINI